MWRTAARGLVALLLGLSVSVMTGGGALAAEVPWRANAAQTTLSYDVSHALPAVVQVTMELAPEGEPVEVIVKAADGGSPLLRLTIHRDKPGWTLRTQASTWSDGEWRTSEDEVKLALWPRDKTARANLEADGIEPRTWHDRPLSLRVVAWPDATRVWLENKLVAQTVAAARGPISLSLTASNGDAVTSVDGRPLPADWRYVPVDLTPIAHDQTPQPMGREAAEVGGVPFHFADHGRRWLDLRSAGWVDWERDPAGYYERYDQGSAYLDDPRMPMIQLPRGDYIAAHVLAVADNDAAMSNRLTLRVGRYDHSIRGQVLRYDFGVDVPRQGEEVDAQAALTTSAGRLYAVRIPMATAFAQDVKGDVLDVELTKQLRVARRSPDPNRYRWRALGLPSGVRIAAITFELSPLQMTVGSNESGHLFVQPQTPSFTIALRNISDAAQNYRLVLSAMHFDGERIVREQSGSVAAGQTASPSLTVPDAQRGYHDLTVALYDGDGNLLLERQTAFAVLPDKDRPHHDGSPIGTWDHGTRHFSPGYDVTGPLYQKLGLRYGMFWASAADHQKYGVRKGNDFKQNMREDVDTVIQRYEADRAKQPSMLPRMMIFHEDSISGPHVTRTPDLFHDRPPYKLSETEQKRFKKMWDVAVQAGTAMRAHDPDVQITLGNGPMTVREEFYRQGFPAELFDAAGNESGVFGRLPEAQPPDIVTNNASLWMDRQMLDYYGYGDKAIVQAHEVIYPSTNVSNLSYEAQAAYLIRHILHSMAWEIPQIRVGTIADVGNSYYFSNWGASGLFGPMPEVSPKPAAVAIATLTWVLDGAAFDRSIDLGSGSLYGLAFTRPDDVRVLALWTVRGERPVTLTLDGATRATHIDSQGVETALPLEGGQVTVTVMPTPGYVVVDSDVVSARAGSPTYEAAPDGDATVVAPLDDLADWRVADGRNPELEFYNPFAPRRKGEFAFEPVAEFDGRDGVIKVTPQPIDHGKATMPMYAELVHDQGIELPGEPTELGVWINGNSGWGRIIYELEDADGERWVSIGAQAARNNRWMADWMPAELLEAYDPGTSADWNTNDVFGLSSINFDGWRYVGFPLPGQYPGEGYHWPANSQWRSDQEGTVDYPLTLKKIIVELPEKVLHIKTFEPVDRPEIYLSDLVAVQGDGAQWIKQTPGTYAERTQVGLFGLNAGSSKTARQALDASEPVTISSYDPLKEETHDRSNYSHATFQPGRGHPRLRRRGAAGRDRPRRHDHRDLGR